MPCTAPELQEREIKCRPAPAPCEAMPYYVFFIVYYSLIYISNEEHDPLSLSVLLSLHYIFNNALCIVGKSYAILRISGYGANIRKKIPQCKINLNINFEGFINSQCGK